MTSSSLAAESCEDMLAATGQNILHMCAKVSLLDGSNKFLHRENLLTFKLVLAALKLRVAAGILSHEAAESLFYELETSHGDTFYSICSEAQSELVAESTDELDVKPRMLSSYLLEEFLVSWGELYDVDKGEGRSGTNTPMKRAGSGI